VAIVVEQVADRLEVVDELDVVGIRGVRALNGKGRVVREQPEDDHRILAILQDRLDRVVAALAGSRPAPGLVTSDPVVGDLEAHARDRRSLVEQRLEEDVIAAVLAVAQDPHLDSGGARVTQRCPRNQRLSERAFGQWLYH
jgi:phage-related baseplate assembly protein